MDSDDILKMLDLDAKSAPAKVVKEEAKKIITAEQTVIKQDEWDIHRGKEIHKRVPLTPVEAVSDFFACVYKPEPEVNECCVDKRRQEYVENLMASSEYKALRQDTILNDVKSEMAAIEFADQYSKLLQEDKNVENLPPRELRRMSAEMRREANLYSAVCQAIKASEEKIEEFNDCARGLGACEGGGTMDVKKTLSLYQKIRNNYKLKTIMELAGRYIRSAQAKQRTKQTHGFDDMIGVETGGDVSRLLPLELVKLADPDFELDAMRRLVERQSMCREYRGIEKQAKGPIVVCVDESSSMDGEPICQAKAFALAMGWIARQQNRWICYVSYSEGRDGVYLPMAPKKWNQEKLVDWLNHFYGRGTDMDVPLDVLPSKWEMLGCPKGKTDLILITDARVNVPTPMRTKFMEWKEKNQVKCISLIIGWSAGELEAVSDSVHIMSQLSVSNEGIEECLSV
jgi:uncharacterized protein with von Willebrand factor type A (vWA) domain